MSKLEELRKLAEEATPGPWWHCQPFQSVAKTRTIHGTVPATRVDFVSTSKEPVHKEIVLPMQTREANIRSENMAFIAAANPQTILTLLDLVELQHEALQKSAYACTTKVEEMNQKAFDTYNKFKVEK